MDKNPVKAESIKDNILKLYYVNIWKRDFSYITKGIKSEGEPEYMFVGKL